jgi:hypothetical protein
MDNHIFTTGPKACLQEGSPLPRSSFTLSSLPVNATRHIIQQQPRNGVQWIRIARPNRHVLHARIPLQLLQEHPVTSLHPGVPIRQRNFRSLRPVRIVAGHSERDIKRRRDSWRNDIEHNGEEKAGQVKTGGVRRGVEYQVAEWRHDEGPELDEVAELGRFDDVRAGGWVDRAGVAIQFL